MVVQTITGVRLAVSVPRGFPHGPGPSLLQTGREASMGGSVGDRGCASKEPEWAAWARMWMSSPGPGTQ